MKKEGCELKGKGNSSKEEKGWGQHQASSRKGGRGEGVDTPSCRTKKGKLQEKASQPHKGKNQNTALPAWMGNISQGGQFCKSEIRGGWETVHLTEHPGSSGQRKRDQNTGSRSRMGSGKGEKIFR